MMPIHGTAMKYNEKNEVTGLLCFSQSIFLHLEGSRTAANNTYNKIFNDKRHENIIMLDYKELIKREFTKWAMGYIPESSLTAPINLK